MEVQAFRFWIILAQQAEKEHAEAKTRTKWELSASGEEHIDPNDDYLEDMRNLRRKIDAAADDEPLQHRLDKKDMDADAAWVEQMSQTITLELAAYAEEKAAWDAELGCLQAEKSSTDEELALVKQKVDALSEHLAQVHTIWCVVKHNPSLKPK